MRANLGHLFRILMQMMRRFHYLLLHPPVEKCLEEILTLTEVDATSALRELQDEVAEEVEELLQLGHRLLLHKTEPWPTMIFISIK